MNLSRAAVYSAESSGTISLVVTITVAPTPGDLLIAGAVMVHTGAQTPVTPAGWTRLSEESQGATDFFDVYYKVSDGTEASVAFALSGGDSVNMAAGVAVYNGKPTLSNYASTQRAGFDNVTAADIGSVLSGEWVIGVGGARDGGSTETGTVSRGSNVETIDIMNAAGGNRRGIMFSENSVDTGSVLGPKFTWTASMTFLYAASMKIAPGSLDFPLMMCM